MAAANMPQLPDYLRDQSTRRVNDQLGGSLGSGMPPHLSIAGGRFTLVDGSGVSKVIETADKGLPYADAIIIDSNEFISKVYYPPESPYDPASPKPPTCFSDNGVAPSRQSSKPQSRECATCQWAAWGSATSKVDPSRGVKACQDYQKLGILVLGFDGAYQLRVPPNSLKALREYRARFAGSEVDMSDVITRISFEPKVLGTLRFAAVDFIKKDMLAARAEWSAAGKTDILVGRGDVPIALAIPSEHKPEAPSAPALPFGDAPAATAQVSLPAAQVATASDSKKRGPGRPPKQAAPAKKEEPPFPVEGKGNSFGIQEGETPDEELSNTISSFFGT